MAYQSTRQQDDEDQAKEEHEHQNAKQSAKTAAKAAGTYFGGAAGAKAVDLASKTKLGDKILDHGAKVIQSNPLLNHASNRLNDSGIMNKADKAIDFAGRSPAGQTPNQVKNPKTTGGERSDGSLPSSDGTKGESMPDKDDGGKKKEQSPVADSSGGGGGSSSGGSDSSVEEESSGSRASSFLLTFISRQMMIMVAAVVLPFFAILLLFVVLAATVIGTVSSFDDAFGASNTAGEENGNISYSTTDKKQENFFERVNDVKLRYQSQGKPFEAYKVAAVYSVIHNKDPKFTYDDMTDEVISAVADAMFEGNYYSDSTFKSNLVSNVFPKYVSSASDSYDDMGNDVIKYIEDYEKLTDQDYKNTTSGSYRTDVTSCTIPGNCNYGIKGYYISGKGTVAESLQIKNLYVRLMQCGTGNGHNYGGRFGRALGGESLVPFEKYILGVAYHEMGDDAPAEAVKAYMIASRSYILARHAAMDSKWRTLKKESGRWILQAAACTQDQVYCDPDKGCSSNDAQWGQVYSGLNHDSGFSKQPMPEESSLRTYATETSGQVLGNKNGHIVYTGYVPNDKDKFISLAEKGLNYKQILFQIYNSEERNYGVTSILKSSCTNSGVTCTNASGDFATWRQTDPAWANVQLGSSGRTIGQIGCNVTSIAIQVAKSGVPTNISDFNPGTFVQALSNVGGFDRGGNMQYYPVSIIAPSFRYQDRAYVAGMSRSGKLNTLKSILADGNNYVIAEVKGPTGQHWVAVDTIEGNSIKMMDPGSNATDMWSEYNWKNTSAFVYFRAS